MGGAASPALPTRSLPDHMSPNKKADLKAVQELTTSRGWAVVREIMEREVVTAAMAIADNPNMTLDEINFRRGSIWAAKQLVEVPERLIRILEADVALTAPASKPVGRTTSDGSED